MENLLILLAGVLLVLIVAVAVIAMFFRRVVDANMVHIVQTTNKTISYGKDTENGNSYYEIPAWVPWFGVTKTALPVSIFDLGLNNYEAYDKGRLPFVVDIKAFFRVTDTDKAAQRVSDFRDLQDQLVAIIQGAVRTILASSEIEEIMEGRSTFGEKFTKEVQEQLLSWGVDTVKNIELMDIRDSSDSHVIENIMKKKKSFIEMESRTEVAKNHQIAKVAEIDANREVEYQRQVADQAVSLRTIENKREVALSEEKASQAVQDQQRVTKEKEMSVVQVTEVRKAEILRDMEIVNAEQRKKTSIIEAEGQKQSATLIAEGDLAAKRREADGIALEGDARAKAEKAMQLAPVQAQIELAKEIGSNQEYQDYLVTVRKVEAAQAVGIEQAKALTQADIKVITNSDSPSAGLTNVMDIFSSKGGTEVGAMLEAFGNTEKGKDLLSKFGKTE